MAANRRKRRYRFSLFPLFPRFQPPRFKPSPDISRLKSMESPREGQTEEGPSCSGSQKPPKRKSWLFRVGKLRKFLFNPLKGLRQSLSSSSKPGSKLTGLVLGCHKGVLRHGISATCKSPSDESDPAEFSHEYVKFLLENNKFIMNARIPQGK